MPFEGRVPEHSRQITEAGAIRHLTEDSYALDSDKGWFIPATEVEQDPLIYGDALMSSSEWHKKVVESYTPRLAISVDPHNMDGTLTPQQPTSHYGAHFNHLTFSGKVIAQFQGNAFRLGENGGIEAIGLADNTELVFTADHPLNLHSGPSPRAVNSISGFLDLVRQSPNQKDQSARPQLRTTVPLALAVQEGVLRPEAITVTPISATAMLHKALTCDVRTNYLEWSRQFLRPGLPMADIMAMARQASQAQWLEVFRGARKLEPRLTGLGRVAARAGILSRYRHDRLDS